MNIHFDLECQIRLMAAAEERAMSVEEFVLDAVERALQPIENRRVAAARDVSELEALWRNADGPGEEQSGDFCGRH